MSQISIVGALAVVVMLAGCPSSQAGVDDAAMKPDVVGTKDAGPVDAVGQDASASDASEPDASASDAAPDPDAAPSADATPDADAAPNADAGPPGPQAAVRLAHFAVGHPADDLDLCVRPLRGLVAPYALYASIGRPQGIPALSVGRFVEVPAGGMDVTIVRAGSGCAAPLSATRQAVPTDENAYTVTALLGDPDALAITVGFKNEPRAGNDQLTITDALAGATGPAALHTLLLTVGGIPQTTGIPGRQLRIPVGAESTFTVSAVMGGPPMRRYVAADRGVSSLFLYGDGVAPNLARYKVCDDLAPPTDELEDCSDTYRE